MSERHWKQRDRLMRRWLAADLQLERAVVVAAPDFARMDRLAAAERQAADRLAAYDRALGLRPVRRVAAGVA